MHSVQLGTGYDGDIYAECTCGWESPTGPDLNELYKLFNRHLADTFGHPDPNPEPEVDDIPVLYGPINLPPCPKCGVPWTRHPTQAMGRGVVRVRCP